jgi:hypothetical protein
MFRVELVVKHSYRTIPAIKPDFDDRSQLPCYPPDGVTFTGATAINNMGQVIVSGVTAVIPEPQSYALMLAGLGLIGFMALRKKIGVFSAGQQPLS